MGLTGALAAPGDPAFVVDSTGDAAGGANGQCASPCTLRAAIQAANTRGGADTILVRSGTYRITIPSPNQDNGAMGDFDISSPMTITAHPANAPNDPVIVDGGGISGSAPTVGERVFEVHPGAGDVTLMDMTIRNGFHEEEGGAIQNWSFGKLTLDGVTVKDSYASKAGGGLNHADLNDYEWTTEPPNLALLPQGRVEIKDSTFMGNGSGGGSGGAINNVSGGTITISDGSEIKLNPGPIMPNPLDPEEFMLADPSDYPIAASAIANQGRWEGVGTIKIVDSTVELNASEGSGAGIANWGDGVITVESSIIRENRSAAEGGGLFSEGGTTTLLDSTITKNQAANGGGLYSGGSVTAFGLRGTFTVKTSQLSENLAESGGALYSGGDGQLSVVDSTFTVNKSLDHGAAIASEDGASITLTRVDVIDNVSNGEGGGVWTHSTRAQTITDSLFTGNDAGVPMIEDGVLSDDVAGGGGLHTDGGPVSVTGTTFEGNTATDEGGGLSIHNLGDVTVSDSVIKNNTALDGGGAENSATRVTFERVTVRGNRASVHGGGIHNTSSGEFSIVDSTIRENVGVIGGGLTNAPDNDLIVRGSLILNNAARLAFTEAGEIDENAGLGGGIMSLADGDTLIENTTISGNKAAVGGGGIFHDADGPLRIVHTTIWRNSAPQGGGVGVVESDFSPSIPPKAFSAFIAKNSIIGGSLEGGSCDWYVRSEGGNLDTETSCFLAVTAATAESPVELGVRDRSGDPDLWAIADNGGPTMTHALQYGSLAIDSSTVPCSNVDQRGEERPQNGRCDSGAYEFVGPAPADDDVAPDTIFVEGPFQNGVETMAFKFRGEDPAFDNAVPPNPINYTAPEDLNFECRMLEVDLVEQPDPVAPWDPVPPELQWNGCSSPWTVPLFEEGMFTFEVRAIDRHDNIDPTPVNKLIAGLDMTPPQTLIVEGPGIPNGQTVPPYEPLTPFQTNNRSALFSFTGISDFTPPQFMEFECRLDSRDPALWLECTNPAMFSNLTTGWHEFEVRALAGEATGPDPTPARWRWHVGPNEDLPSTVALNCDQANVVLTPSADGWADQVTPLENYLFYTDLTVRSAQEPGPNGGSPIGANARSFFRFPLTNDAPDCELESATLRLYASSNTAGRELEAALLEDSWKESTLTWANQPDPLPTATPTTTDSGELYREWNVLDQVNAIFGGDPNNGWVIRDAQETDAEGGDQAFHSREMPQDPPDNTLPELVLRFEPAAPTVPPARIEPTVETLVTCGQIITESTLVDPDSELGACLGEGIGIGAPNIILDLNGVTVKSGLLLELGEEDGLTPGVRNSYPNVEIRNGTITGFGYGVLLGPGATGNDVHDLVLTRNILAGVHLFDADDGRNGNRVYQNLLDSNGAGVELFSGSEGSEIYENTFKSNSIGIYLNAAHWNEIHDNEISGLILDPLLDSDAGIVLENGSRNNTLERNNVSDTGDAGIVVHQGSHDTRIEGGVLVRNGDAGVIAEASDRVSIIGITSHQQSDGGVVLGNSSGSSLIDNDLRFNPSGLEASNTNGLTLQGNDASNSLQAGFGIGNGLGMTIRDNTANQTGGSGISVEGGAFDTAGNPVGGATIEGNTTNENLENGLAIADGGHTIRDNDAHNNAGFGILAGELDGGTTNIDGPPLLTNRATGNGEFVQCLGVVCDETGGVGPGALDTTPPVTELTDGPGEGDGAIVSSETAVFEFRATDLNPDLTEGTPLTAMVFECRLDAPDDPAIVEPPDTEPPDPGDPGPDPVEGEGWAECVSPHTIIGLEPGTSHRFEVRAVDQAGSWDLTPERYEWSIQPGADDGDTFEDPPVPPDTRITSAPGETMPLVDADGDPVLDGLGEQIEYTATTNRTAALSFLGSDNLTAGYNLAFECRHHYDANDAVLESTEIPGTLEWQECESPAKYPADLMDGVGAGDPTPPGVDPANTERLLYGGHIFQVRAIDRAGNEDISPASHSWWIQPPPPDTEAPVTQKDSGPDPTTALTTAMFEFSGTDNQTPIEELAFECRLDPDEGDLWEGCTSPHSETVTNSATSATTHILQVRAVDQTGNPDDTPEAYVWDVSAAPVTQTIFCGQKITKSIIVNNNLGDCLGHGLIVGASGITIDLNGKTIDGKSIGAGILNNGYDSVTIKNGRLMDFDYGVMLNNGSQLNIIEGVTTQQNQDAGIGLGQPTFPEDPNLSPGEPAPGFQSQVNGNIVRSSTMVANNRGVWLLNGASGNVVLESIIGQTSGEAVFIDRASSNRVEGNDIQAASKVGVLLEGATDNVVIDNSIADVGTGVLVSSTTSGTTGIESTGNRIEGNLISDGGPALRIHQSSGNELVDNVGTGADTYAAELYLADDNVLRGNDLSGNKGGIAIMDSSGNQVEENDTSQSDSTGIVLESGSLNNVLLRNESSNNDGSGIYIGIETPSGQGTLVEGNITNANNGMGIQASKPSHIFVNNAAFDNGSWGINVGDPSGGRSNIDGGGNVAQGNAGPLGVDLKPQQCYNITCSGGPGGGDAIAPSTTILEAPFDGYPDSLVEFRFTGADNATPVTFECRFYPTSAAPQDVPEFATCTSPKTYSNLTDGSYTFEVQARDFSENVDPTPATYTFGVELGDLAVTITSQPDKVTVSPNATFEFSASPSDGVTFTCALVLGAAAPVFEACTSPNTYPGIAPGAYTFHVRATNGGASPDSTASYSWTIGPPPVATEVFCGQILMQSTKLLNDLTDCGGYGLIVGTSGITIDLDGHFVDGMGLDAGIFNNGHDDVTITNGLVREFLNGVQLNPGSLRNVVSNLRVELGAEAGIALGDADQASILNNSLVGNEYGIALYSGTNGATVRGNSLSASGGEGGIYLEFAQDNLVEQNQLSATGGHGIYLAGGGNNTVVDNVVRTSGGYGIAAGADLLQSNGNLVRGNTIQGGGGGVIVSGTGNEIFNNDVSGTTGPGVALEIATDTLVKGNDFGGNASGIALAQATGNTIEGNNASGTLGSGIEIGELSTNNVVRGNTASGNGGAGIEVTESTAIGQGNEIVENTADANGGDGIYVEGSGHEIADNAAHLNGGWGIYYVGPASGDAGGNVAVGNMEPDQCFGVVCGAAAIDLGAPDTWIVSGPADIDPLATGVQSNSRNASFTYMGEDDFSPITELVFECRIDSTNALGWEDCEYPAEFLNLSPGQHTIEIRAIDQLGAGVPDPTPAAFEWTYIPLATGVAPEAIIDIAPPTETFLPEGVFTFHSNEPDVTFQCQVDTLGWQPCGFEGAASMNQGAFEVALEPTDVGPHTFRVRAIDFEGNVSVPNNECVLNTSTPEAGDFVAPCDTYTWTLLGVTVAITDGPGFTPAVGGPAGDPATGGPTASTSAEIVFEANVGDPIFWCRFDDPAGNYFPCESPFRVGPGPFSSPFPATLDPEPLAQGEHLLEVYAESETMASAAELEPVVYEWEVVPSVDAIPPETTLDPSSPAVIDPSSTTFVFAGTDNMTPSFLLTFQCQLTAGGAAPNELDWVDCFSPFNVLDVYEPALLTPQTFHVRAFDLVDPEFPNPLQPDFEGNPDPTPASFTWTPVADTVGPSVFISSGIANGATVGALDTPFTFVGEDNATPDLQVTFECAVGLAPLDLGTATFEPCGAEHSLSGLEPGFEYTFAVRGVDLALNRGPAITRTFTLADAPVVTILSGPLGQNGAFPLASTENAIFTFSSDQAGSTFECSLDGSDFAPCNTASGTPGQFAQAYWVVTNGQHTFEIRALNAQAIVGEEIAYTWVVQLGPDTEAPNTSITSGPSNGTLSQDGVFTFTGLDNRTPTANLSFECELDLTGSWNSCVSPQQSSQFTRGEHTIRVRAIDAAGNMDPTPASYTWTVAPPPFVTILTGPGVTVQESTDTTATFTFSSDVADVKFECWLDGAYNPPQSDPIGCVSPAIYPDLGYGPHLFAVRAVDEFGNIGEWEDSEFTVLPPQAKLTAVPATGTSTTATFEFESDPLDPTAAFYCALDGSAFGSCESPHTYENLFPGEHTFEVQTIYTGLDWLGEPLNFDPVPASYTWTVQDFTAPQTFIDFGPPATTTSVSAYLQVSTNDPTATIACSLDGALPEECEPGVVIELTELTLGNHTFTAVATDPSLNVDPTPATHAWTVEAPSGPANTQPGTNVVVELPPVTVTFASVETAGTTTLGVLSGGPALPEGYGGGGTILDISTTALFTEPVTICLEYDPDLLSTAVRLLHFDGELWLDITTTNNPFVDPARVCGLAESFSLFAIAAASSGLAPETSILSGPTGPLGASGLPTSTSGSATFAFWADQPGSMTQCSIDGDPYFFCESPLTVGPLEAGEHEFLVQAINEFGWMDLTPAIYEWEIIGPDVTPPNTTIVSGPSEGSFTPNFINFFGFSGTDDFTQPLDFEFQCWLDTVDLGNCETPAEIEVLTPGEHTLEVAAIDAAGNVDQTPVARTWTVVDMSGPDTEITLGPEEETLETSATFEFAGFELLDGTPVTQFECALDGSDFAPCTSPYPIAGPLAEGAHAFQARAIDPDGNIDISPAFYTWLIIAPPDETAPNTFIVVHPPTGNSGPDATFVFAADEAVEGFECALDQATPTTWQDCETLWILEALATGQHTLWVRSYDIAGNTDLSPAGADLGFGPDATPFTWTTVGEPDTMILSGPPATTGEFSATFTFESDQAGATFQCSQDGSAFVPCTSPYLTGPFLPGEGGAPLEHEFEVRAVNQFVTAEGLQVVDLTPALHAWTVQDTEAPDTEFLGATEIGPEQLLEPGLRFTFRGDDNGGTSSAELEFECLIDNTSDAAAATWETCGELAATDSFSHDIVFADLLADLGAGEYTFQVRAIDFGANVDATPAPVVGDANYDESTFVIEAEPETTIDLVTPDMGVDVQTDATEVTFTFSSTTAGATFVCALDSTTFTPCTSGTPYTDVPYGEHLFSVMAVAPFGTLDPEPAVFEWVSGYLTAPPVQIDTGPALTTDLAEATFTFSSSDTSASFRCSLDGAAFVPCLSPLTYTGLQAGVEHTFEVEATMANLLVPTNVATYTWTITDTAPPETSITVAPALTTGPDVSIQFTGTDNGTPSNELTFQCSLDGATFAGCSSPLALSGLAGGPHTFEVRALDGAGLFDMSAASAGWNVVAPPNTTIASGPAQPTSAVDTATFTFTDQPGSTFECRLDPADANAPWTACASGVIYNGLSNGAHLFEVRAIAPELNGTSAVEDTPATWAWNVNVADTTAPDTQIDLGPAATTTSTSATLFFSGTDNATAPGALTFECSLDGAAFTACSSGVTYTDLTATGHTFEVRARDAALNPDGSPASHAWTVESGTTNTDVGLGEVVDLGSGATATFTEVTSAGVTTYTDLSGAPSLPTGYSNAIFFDVSTTAGYLGSITICVPYNTTSLDEPHMLHYDDSWTDVTTSVDPDAGIVCGTVSNLSPFALAEAAAALAPTTAIETGPSGSTYATDATFSFSSNDALATFGCSLDGSGWSSCSNPKTYNGLAPGAHELFARAVNSAGNVDYSPAKRTWTILPKPETSLTTTVVDQLAGEPEVQTGQSDATFTLSSDQPGGTFQCRLETETSTPSWSACTSPVSYTGLTLGEHTFEARAINADNEVDPTPVQYDWEVADLTAPTVTVTGPTSPIDATSATFQFSADEPATFECSVNGDVFNPCTPPSLTVNNLTLGSHTLDVRAADLSARNNLSATVRYTVTVSDQTVPSVSIGLTPGPQIDEGETATFTFSGSDNWTQNVTFECRVTNTGTGDFAACTSPYAIADMQPGEWIFDVRAKDGAGNPSAVATHPWTVVDTTPPDTLSSMSGGSITFTFSGTDNYTAQGNLSFQCKLDGGSWFGCTSPYTYSTAALQQMVGSHTFQIRAIDQAGNSDPSPQSHNFTVDDTTSPETSLTGQPTNNTTNPDASFTFTGTDNATATASLTYECSLDGAALATCTSPSAYTGLSVGQHSFQVRAKDAAGLVDATPASYTWTIQQPADTGAPDTSITGGQPPATTTVTSASFSFAGTDSVTPAGSLTFQCSLDTGSYATCTTPQAYSSLSIGQHTFRVRAVDAAGNIDQSPATYTWTVTSSTVNCGNQQTLTANADAWIDQSSPSSNKGSDSILKVMSKSGNGNLRAVVRFALPSMPQGCSVETATLRIYAKSAANGRTLQAWMLGGSSWSEGGITWANQPATTNGAVTVSSGTGYRDWNVAGMVQAQYGSGNNGFLIRDANENQDAEQQFQSREESNNRPQLVLKFGTGAPPSPPPPPGGGPDTTPPDTSLTGQPQAATQSTSASFTFTGSDNVTATGSLTYECQIDVPDTSPWIACTSPRNLTNLAIGSHIFRVRAKDAAGNVDLSPAVYTWTIDQTAPETIITQGPLASTTSTSASFQFQSPETGATFACALDTAPLANCASPATYSNLAVGQHTFQVQATDAAGNVDPTPASYPWTIQPGGTPVDCGTTTTVTSEADAWIEQSSPSSNKGTDATLKVMSKSGNSNLRALVRFNLPTMPAGCTIDTATLRLYADSASSSQRTLEVFRLDGAWSEGGVNWGNQPDTAGDSATTTSGTGYREWGVEAIVQNMYSSGQNNGFLVKDATEGQDAEQQFFAREKGESPPQLVIEFKPST